MKRISFTMKSARYMTLCAIAAAAFACSDEKDKGAAPAGSIQVLSADSDYGAVVLKWKAPHADPNYAYTAVQWTDHSGKARSVVVSAYAGDTLPDGAIISSTTADGFSRAEAVTFSLTPYGRGGGAGNAVSIQGTPLSPAYSILTMDVAVKLPGAVEVTWNNNTDRLAYVEVTYGKGAGATTIIITATTTGKRSITGLPAGELNFTLKAKDRYDNYGQPITKTLLIPEEMEIPKDQWSVPGQTDGTNYPESGPALGYDSQEENVSDSDDGGVIAVFDGNTTEGGLHSNWSDLKTPYPHWFVIDLGKEYRISRVAMQKRSNNHTGQVGYSIKTATMELTDEVEPANVPSWTGWTDQGHTVFVQTMAMDGVKQSFTIDNFPVARYIMWYCSEEDKGNGDYMMVREVWVYGAEVQ